MHKVLDGCQLPATLRDVLPPKSSAFSDLKKREPFDCRSSATGQAAHKERGSVDEMVLRQLSGVLPSYPGPGRSRSE